MICFKIRIFAQRQTSSWWKERPSLMLWFALKFVSLHKDKHLPIFNYLMQAVVICFKIRIFAQRQTSASAWRSARMELWFALKFVSLHKDKHLLSYIHIQHKVVICFKIRIFAQRQTSHNKTNIFVYGCDLL